MCNQYLLVGRSSRQGRAGRTMWRFTWYSLEDGQLWETTVDDSYRNWRRCHWAHIASEPDPWGCYTGLTRTQRTTRTGLPVITADSRPRLDMRLDWDTCLQVIEQDQINRSGQAQYHNLFDHDTVC